MKNMIQIMYGKKMTSENDETKSFFWSFAKQKRKSGDEAPP